MSTSTAGDQPTVEIRDATDADLEAIRALYNVAIPTSTIAWTETPQTLLEREKWFRQQQTDEFPVLVAQRDHEVIGFAAYGSFRGSGKWPGYRHTVEHTIHVRDDVWGQGVGRTLLTSLIDRARSADVHVMVAAVDGANHASIAFHERLEFTIVARMPEVGRKFDRWLDLVLMQRII